MINRREFIGGAAAGAAAAPASRPNILLIMTDQHRADAIGAYGNPVIRTPHLDSLAEGGARFTNCWTQHPVCMPSRASIFTGRYPSAHRVRTNGVRLPLSETTIARALLDAGYSTFGAGKFHFVPQHPYRSPLPTMETHPQPYYGFGEFHLGEDARTGERWQWVRKNHPRFHLKPDHQVPHEVHNTGWVADHTIAFLKRAAGLKTPFFAFTSFVDPHHPYNPPSPYDTMYRGQDMPPLVTRASERDGKPPVYARLYDSYRPLVDNAARHRTQDYGEISFIDDAIGRILRTLEESKLRENTLIVFTSDHVDMLGDHYLFHKGLCHYRQCAAVPLIVNWPGTVPPGKVVQGIVQEIDIMPTLLDLAGVAAVAGVQGRSQRPVLTTGAVDTGYTSALVEGGTSGVTLAGVPVDDSSSCDVWTLRTKQWRLSYYPGLPASELYDLTSDPDEFTNLWGRPALKATQDRLTAELLDRILQAHDPLPPRERPY